MMGQKNGQLSFTLGSMTDIIPEHHLLRRINAEINFNFIYRLAKPYYSERGRPSVDPVCLIKMVLVGYLYGIKSERRLVEEITLNIAYRWFCGFNMMDKIPDHSVFSQNRRRRFQNDGIFRGIFNELIIRCIKDGLVTGEKAVCDGSFIPANISEGSIYEMKSVVSRSTVAYMDELDEEMSTLPGYRAPQSENIEKTIIKSTTDEDCGFINQVRKKGMGYLAEMTVDTQNGIITGVDCYPANRRESDIVLHHIKKQMCNTGLTIKKLALDAGYDVGAVHRGFEKMGVVDYCCPRELHNNALKKGFVYDTKNDSFHCMKGKELHFYRLTYKKNTQNYYRLYRIPRTTCSNCEFLEHCSVDKGAVRINASAFYPAYHKNRERCKSVEYQRMKRLRSIWSEGTFAALKNNHNLHRLQKRGMMNATSECLLAALALNLKRIVGASPFVGYSFC